MKAIVTDKMNIVISYIPYNVVTFSESFAYLSAFKSVDLFSDSEYSEYLLRIRQAEIERISYLTDRKGV